ncbi:uncharacterized protein LOC121736693 [Aricia agestis]|uniref:uncharacterized protein LOC121736693 n=1 Tax=Aricia agestis TaxID=91739 RepID=UPI001C202474|nr:uncharacterized protein LOC121736693 [Aricia agestis]
MEPQKPFVCTLPDCGMSFTNEDHLHVHTKKHDMILQLGMEQKAAFVADQTPTPTRFIRNCEEVGLFQDLQSVNPFDEGFKRAMMDKQGVLSVESEPTSEDVLHTPHLVFPLEPGDTAQYTANNKQNITISRSSSDETGAVKEYETTTISKLTNKVTTISRVVSKPDVVDRVTDDVSIVRHENNVIKIHSNVEIRKDEIIDANKDVKSTKYVKKDAPPIMSQQSIDLVVDSLMNANSDKSSKNFKRKIETDESNKSGVEDDLEVIVRLPSGKNIRMKAVDEENKERNIKNDTKEKLKHIIASKNKVASPNTPVQLPCTTATLIPITIVTPKVMKKVPIPVLPIHMKKNDNRTESIPKKVNTNVVIYPKVPIAPLKPRIKVEDSHKSNLENRSAASKRYRERFKEKILRQEEENRQLKEKNKKLAAEKAALQYILTKHMKTCPNPDDIREFQNADKFILNEI